MKLYSSDDSRFCWLGKEAARFSRYTCRLSPKLVKKPAAPQYRSKTATSSSCKHT